MKERVKQSEGASVVSKRGEDGPAPSPRTLSGSSSGSPGAGRRSGPVRTAAAGANGQGWTPDRVRGDGAGPSSPRFDTADARSDCFTAAFAGTTKGGQRLRPGRGRRGAAQMQERGASGAAAFGQHRRQCGSGVGCGHRLSFRDGERVPFPRVSRAGAPARAGARFAAARLARLIARARQRAQLSRRLLTCFQKTAPLGRAAPGEAAPEPASLGTIIPHSARCQAPNTNKIQKYRKLFMFRRGCERASTREPFAPPMDSPCPDSGESSDLDRLTAIWALSR